MRIGIDISQVVYEGSGVAAYVKNIIPSIVAADTVNTYILFGTSFRQRQRLYEYFDSLKSYKNVRLVCLPLPGRVFEFLWNRLGIVPIEWLIGKVDVFWSSDWMQPPLSTAKGITTIHDVSFIRYPHTFPQSIIDVQTRRLGRVVGACKKILCDSEATKNDVHELLHVPVDRLVVIYPGYTAL